MALRTRPSTTEMQVTSIRFEKELIDRLKEMAGNQGYQSLVREVLWKHVKQQPGGQSFQIRREEIRTIMAAEAVRQEQCALTGSIIQPHEEMWLAMTIDEQLVPVSIDGLEAG